MKAVYLNAMLIIKFVGHGISFCLLGNGLVEGGIKNSDLLGIGKDFFREYNSFKIMGIVQWCQGSEFVYLVLYLLIDKGGLGKTIAPVYYPMPDGIDLPGIFKHPYFRIYQQFGDTFQTFPMVFYFHSFVYLGGVRSIGKNSVLGTDPFYDALADYRLRGH